MRVDAGRVVLRDVVRTAPYKPAVAYGLGVQSVTIAGHPTLGHSGRFLGARAAVRWLTDEHIAIALITNQSRTDTNAIVAEVYVAPGSYGFLLSWKGITIVTPRADDPSRTLVLIRPGDRKSGVALVFRREDWDRALLARRSP